MSYLERSSESKARSPTVRMRFQPQSCPSDLSTHSTRCLTPSGVSHGWGLSQRWRPRRFQLSEPSSMSRTSASSGSPAMSPYLRGTNGHCRSNIEGSGSGLGASISAACLATSFSKNSAANGDTGFPRWRSPTVQLLHFPRVGPAQPTHWQRLAWLQGKSREKPLRTPSIQGLGTMVSFFLATSAPSTKRCCMKARSVTPPLEP